MAAAALLAMLAIICFDVLMRYVFNSPTTWATEIATYLLVAIAFLGMAYTHLQGAHIRMDFLISAVSPITRTTLTLIAEWLGFIFVAFAAWQSVVMTWENFVNGTRIFSLLYTPVYLPQIPIAIGFIAFGLAILANILRHSPPRAPAWLVPAFVVVLAAALALLGARPALAFGGPFDWGSILIVAATLVVAGVLSGWRVLFGVVAILLGVAVVLVVGRDVGPGSVIAIEAAITLFFLAIGVRVGLALGLVGLTSLYFLLSSPAPITLAERSWQSVNSFTLTAVPMFVLMGALLLRSGLSEQVFEALAKWMGRFPGGIAHAGVGACTIFAAVSGSSLATAATMGIVACPEMEKRGYNPKLAYGSIAAGGTLGILIPPSIAMIIYGSTVGAPVATLFIAGIVPGALLALSFMGVVFVWALIDRNAAPRGERFSWRARFAALLDILPIALLIGAVLGVLYAGVATPTEAGAMGAMAALAICYFRRRLDRVVLLEVLLETVRVTAFLFLIIVGAAILTHSFDYLRLPKILVEAVTAADLSPLLVMIAISLVYIVLGMFIDSISMMVMTLPVIFPVVVGMGFDPIWFGVVVVILMEIGLITPPVGMNLFALRGIGERASMTDIVHGVIPFALIMVLGVVLLYWQPGLATWLPATMR